MYINPVNEIAFTFCGISIYWYGIIMALAIFVGITFADNLFIKTYIYGRKEIFYEFAPLIVVFGLLSARLYFCALNMSYYLKYPLEILDFRQGGLSVHGAIIGGVLAFMIVAKYTKTNLLRLLDIASCATIISQSIGRWGNYFNSEAYGIPTNQQWGLFIPAVKRLPEYYQFQYYHPTFLYECLLDFGGFIILYKLLKKYQYRDSNGIIFFLYLIIYSIIRLVIEPLRIDSALKIGEVSIAIYVSVIFLIVGIVGLLMLKFAKSKNQ